MPFPRLATKKKLQNQNSCISHSASSSFALLPNEILCRILTFLPTPDLIPLHTIPSVILKSMVANELVARFARRQLGIRLCFDQEARWRYTLDMKLVHQKTPSSRLCFIPMAPPPDFAFFVSKLLRRPTLYKVCLIATDEDLTRLPDDLLASALTLDIKHLDTLSNINGFRYRVTAPPPQVTKSRPGERWLHPCRFECTIDFLCQTRSGLTKWFDKLHGNKPTRRRMTGLHTTATEKLPFVQGQVAELGITHVVDKHLDTHFLIPNILSQ